MKLRAIHLYAGTGTMTRAFQKHGVDVVWAWEPNKDLAEVYRLNFPEISLSEKPIEEIDESQIPEYDLLLARIIMPPLSVRAHVFPNSKVMEVVEKTRPRAFCFVASGWMGRDQSSVRQMIQTLCDWGYYVQYKLLDAAHFGGVPFKGRGVYIIGCQQGSGAQEFVFPEQTECRPLDPGYLDREAEEEWKLYDKIPDEIKAFIENNDVKTGSIYYHNQRKEIMGRAAREKLIHCDYCPKLNQREWYNTYVQGEHGLRRLSWREYLVLQEDKETELPVRMANSKIWYCLGHHGLYTVECRVAERLVKFLDEKAEITEEITSNERSDIPRDIATGFLSTISNLTETRDRQLGLICMPAGTGRTSCVGYLIQGLKERTYRGWRHIVLCPNRQIEESLQQRLEQMGLAAVCGNKQEELDIFMEGYKEVLITTYGQWERYTENMAEHYHVGVCLIALEAERCLDALQYTFAKLPQAFYIGISNETGAEHSEGLLETFGKVKYMYQMSDAVKDGIMVPLYGMALRLDQRKQDTTDTESGQAFVTEIFRDNLRAKEGQKSLVVVKNRMQAAAFCAELDRLKSAYLANSQIEAEKLGLSKNILEKRLAESESFFLSSMAKEVDRQEVIHRLQSCKRGILVMVSMLQGWEIPEVSVAYVVGQKSYWDLLLIASRITGRSAGKNYVRMVFCGCDYEKLLGEGIIKEWPQMQDLVQSLWQDDYQKGYSLLNQLIKETGSVGMAMEQELHFLYPAGDSRKKRQELWGERRESLQLLRTIWCLTAQYAGTFGRKWLDEACCDLAERTEETASQEEPEALPEAKAEGQDKPGRTFASSYEQGAFLENAVMELLQLLFQLDQESIADLEKQVSGVLDLLRRQNSGWQGGYDIRVAYRQSEADRKRVCLFECKYKQVTEITIADIAGKLEQVKLTDQDIEHWILVAPRAKFANDVAPYLDRLAQHPGGQLPIKDVQVWGEDNGISELFGLVPELYHAIYGGGPEDEDAPERWSASRRRQVLKHWKQKLLPAALLPDGFLDYPEKPERLLFDVQNDGYIRRQYEDLYKHYIRLHYYDAEGRYMEGTLEADLEKWLYQSTQTAKVLLGEFGDGKTFFLYSFCRRLLENFREDPEKHYLPICFSLRRMRESKNAAEFIEERMEELGATLKDFLELKRRYHVLVCLDGLDEMTAEMDARTQLRNAKRLISCCAELKDVRILITSRIQCFESHNVRDMLRERIGEFDVWKLAQIPREEARQYLYAELQERIGEQEEAVLQEGSGWLALSGKPLFIEMMRELWEDEFPVNMSENEIYDKYIHKCLRRKFQESYDRSDIWVKEEDTVRRIYQALRQIAVRMQEKGQERLSLGEVEAFLDVPLSKILWEEDAEDESISEDARNRFSMRSLFRREAGEEISFVHRSIREYFVGMHLLELLEKDLPEFYNFLELDICNYEVYRFLANGINGGERETLMNHLLSLLPQCCTAKSVAAAKILQICYLVDTRIMQGEWSEQNLDGVYIPGADLSGQKLSHSSIRNANLNNIVLNDADCSYCDFTGSRLEETTRVEAVGQSEERIRAVYADGIVRDWEPERMEHKVCWEEQGGYERAILLEQGWLALRASGQWELYGTEDQPRSLLRYWKDGLVTILDISAAGILLTWQTDADRYLTAVIDYKENKVKLYRERDGEVLGKLCGENAAVISDGQNVCLWNMESGQEYTFPLRAGKLREIAARRKAGEYHLAMLAEGRLILARCQSDMADFAKREHPLALEGVHHVAIVQENYIALGSFGGTVSIVYVNWRTLDVKWEQCRNLQLGVYCRNVKTEGLVPPEMRERLEQHRG